jgi:hypothetical protein
MEALLVGIAKNAEYLKTLEKKLVSDKFEAFLNLGDFQ